MPTEAFAERILRFVKAKGYKPRDIHQLAEAMGVGEDEQGDFHAACKALMKTGRIVLGGGNALTLPDPPGRIVGTFRGNRQGFGFVVPDSPNAHGDLYIPAGSTGGAVTGDTVVARVLRRGKRGGRMRYDGRIVEIVQRGQSRFVGELLHRLGHWIVIPEGNLLHAPIEVGDPGAKNAREGDQVVVEVTRYPSEGRSARGVIVKVLGRHGEPDVDTSTVIEQYQLPREFSEDALREGREAAAAFDPARDMEGREDLRKLTVITIDPADARDFDDAISLTKNKDGTVELGVHIADVARFVPEGGALDGEAKERSTSVYLGRSVVPMLPETLSNDACSLQERRVRLTKSVFITYDKRGRVKKARPANSAIRSTKRLTYEQATAILDGRRGRVSAKVVSLLKEMERLAKAIRARRLREGMLELDLPEAQPVYDAEGRVVDVKPADTSFSHKIIEMFMVEANEAVARFLSDRKIPFLRRIHDEPRDLAAGNLRRFLGVLGHSLPAHPDRFELQKLLDTVRGKSKSFPVHLAILRSLPQAEYSPAPLGHYALASKNYCHFTSPIRRYPDLAVHRFVDRCLSRRQQAIPGRRNNRQQAKEELAALGRHCSANERRAEAAERELALLLTLRLLAEKFIGEELAGVVTGVTNIGLFVQLDRFLVDGLVRFERMANDWWEVDSQHGCVIGERTGRRITIGDPLRVIITQISIPARRIELAPADAAEDERPSRRKKQAQRRRPSGRTPPERRRKTRRRTGR